MMPQPDACPTPRDFQAAETPWSQWHSAELGRGMRCPPDLRVTRRQEPGIARLHRQCSEHEFDDCDRADELDDAIEDDDEFAIDDPDLPK